MPVSFFNYVNEKIRWEPFCLTAKAYKINEEHQNNLNATNKKLIADLAEGHINFNPFSYFFNRSEEQEKIENKIRCLLPGVDK